MKKTKILIAGIGGVGGYFGGLLAKHYEKSDEVDICFLAKGKHLKVIQRIGLKVIKGKDEIICQPQIATDNALEIGIANFIIICTKTYSLESLIEQLKPCIDSHTIIIPLLNGVDSKERIQNYFPDNLILDGCVYIVSRLKEQGVIENSGNIQKLFFGSDNSTNESLQFLERILLDANIEANLSANIVSVVWEKFIFISATASATSYFNNCIGEILSDVEKRNTLIKLIDEVKNVALTKGINIPDDILNSTLKKLEALPFETTSSMHTDFKNKKNTELESLTEYVIKEGNKLNIATITYNKIHNALINNFF